MPRRRLFPAWPIACSLLACLPALAARAAEPVAVEQLKQMADAEYDSLQTLYKSLHREPELSLQEAKTAKRFAAELTAAGYAVTADVGGHGVVGVLNNGDGPTLLLRTDLDALPVKEQTGVEYASVAEATDPAGKAVPVMHACGHDIHIASMVGTARLMAKLKGRWSGTLVIIGQPAEEVGKGAKAMLEGGLFTRFPRPDYGLALHVDSELPTGTVGYVSGFAMANVDSVDIAIRGVGGHGAQPHTTKDPIVIAAQVVLALQTIASRETRPTDPVVVTVGSIHGGTKHNVIPDEVTMQLTVRTYKEEVRARTLKAIERIATGTARTAGVPDDRLPVVSVKDEYTPALYNTPALAERVTGVLRRTVGEANVVARDPSMGGEDFGRYGRDEPRIPVFMYRLGSIPPEQAAAHKDDPAGLPSLHSSKYLPEPDAIRTGVMTMTAAALDLLTK